MLANTTILPTFTVQTNNRKTITHIKSRNYEECISNRLHCLLCADG